ncbi:MAG: bifunctional DNA primase/polymerase, partial [Trebonia sp.]
MSDRLMRAALAWAERGWHVFPCAPGGKPPAIPGQDWQDLATTDPGQIRSWWARRPYNIGIDCGRSGLVVVDLDIPGHGRRAPGEVPDRRTGLDTLARLCAEQGQPVPGSTFTVGTPSGGLHLYFSPAGIPVGSSKERLGLLIDVRGIAGYVIAAGSYRDGGFYDVLNPASLVPLPSWIAELHETPEPPPASVRIAPAAGVHDG